MNKIITLTEIVAEWPTFTNRDHAAHVLQEQGFRIVEDEVGRPGLSVADVKRWRAAELERLAMDDARQAEFDAWSRATREWEAGRVRVAREAAAKARAGSRSPGSRAANDDAREAAEHYERTTPRPLFDGKPGVALCYIAEDQVGSLAGRVVSRTKRALGVEGVPA